MVGHLDPFVTSPAHARALDLMSQARPDPDCSGFSAALQKICLAATAGLPVSGAAVHLVVGGDDLGVAAASDEAHRAFAEMAFTTGVAPCVDAFRARRPVLVPDLTRAQTRWPGFTADMLDAGVGAVFALPLQTGAVALGVLDLFAREARALDDDELGLAFALATLATQLLLGGEGSSPSAEQVGASIDHRPEIHQAQGMVMVALGIPLVEALLRLRAHAFAHGVPLIQLAREVVAGRNLPEAWNGQ